jgi:nicotinamidase/pyrazinamidase
MKALIVVDAQYDFMPVTEKEYKNGQGGALAVPNGDQIVPVINELLPQFDLIIFTKDWHPKGMKAFASSYKTKKPFDTYKVKGKEDTLWPDHCIAESYGAMIHEGIDLDLMKDEAEVYFFKKGLEKDKHPYSGFDGTGLGFFLREKNIETVFICGLATDYCCKDTAIDANNEGFETFFIMNATKPINPDITKTIKELHLHGVKMIDSWQLPLTFLTQ